MVHTRRVFGQRALAVLAATQLPACTSSSREVVVYTSVDQPFSEPIFRAFEKTMGVKARAVFDTEETKSTGVVNRLIAESAKPQADVFWSGDPVRPFLLMNRGLVEPYASPRASGIPAGFRAADGSWTGFAARARVLLVNKKQLGDTQLPTSIRDLAAPRYQGKTAIANPLFGTTTMHVAALFVAWGSERARRFMKQLKDAGVRIVSSNGEVKRLVVAGEITFGLTDTDDANEALKAGAPVEVVYPDQDELGTLAMPTTVVLIKGRPHPEHGKLLVDFLISAGVEKQLAEAGAHMPLRKGVVAPGTVRSVSSIRAMSVDYAKVAREMESIQPWLRQWAGL
ncbi:MAG: extracellular solute-binding protein [Deltaproteobacteria bacterium]|nr:extracellular solute-binding protein [Deltaproteobacteria bacterium]